MQATAPISGASLLPNFTSQQTLELLLLSKACKQTDWMPMFAKKYNMKQTAIKDALKELDVIGKNILNDTTSVAPASAP